MHCNYGNRLGVSKEVGAYFPPEPAQPTVKVKEEEAVDELDRLQRVAEKLEELKGEKE